MSMTDTNNEGGRSDEHRCLQSLIEVFLYIDGQLDDERAAEITSHLSVCEKCYGRVEFEKLVKGYVKKRNGREEAPSGIVNSVSQMLEGSGD
jgi:mycothiol system anti-sigma-R factor